MSRKGCGQRGATMQPSIHSFSHHRFIHSTRGTIVNQMFIQSSVIIGAELTYRLYESVRDTVCQQLSHSLACPSRDNDI